MLCLLDLEHVEEDPGRQVACRLTFQVLFKRRYIVKTIKVLVLTLALGLAAFAYTTEDARSSADRSDATKASALCCRTDAGCCKSAVDGCKSAANGCLAGCCTAGCCTPGADCKSSECCCVPGSNCCMDGKCGTPSKACCASDTKCCEAGAEETANVAAGGCGSSCKKGDHSK